MTDDDGNDRPKVLLPPSLPPRPRPQIPVRQPLMPPPLPPRPQIPVRRPQPPKPPRPATLPPLTRLPKGPRGRPTPARIEQYEIELERFCEWITVKDAMMRRDHPDFRVGVRGWCYLLEGNGTITKGQFIAAERLITKCRKEGRLPLNICAEDES